MDVSPLDLVTACDIYVFALDTLFYATRVCARPPGGAPALGETIAQMHAERAASVCSTTRAASIAPSTVSALIELTSTDLYTTRPPHVAAYYNESNPQFYTAWHRGLRAAQSVETSETSGSGSAPVQFVPISTVEWDNTMLRWPRVCNRPLCASGDGCAATSLPGAPGPLPAYRTQGCAADAADGGYCLLCIREDVEGLVLMSAAKAPTCGLGPTVQPPFKNVVGCPGGYKETACVVKPGSQQVFVGGVHIVGTSGALAVRLDVARQEWFVDQSPLIFDPMGSLESQHPFLGGGVGAEKRTRLR